LLAFPFLLLREPSALFDRVIKAVVTALGVAFCLYTLVEVNYNLLQPQSALAIFVGLGLVICYLTYPVSKPLKKVQALRWLDILFAVGVAITCGYVVFQTEPTFRAYWSGGFSLGDRAGVETSTDFVIGLIGLILVLEATRRSIGATVPVLSLIFVFHSYYCYLSYQHGWPVLPEWMLPHAGQSLKDIVGTTYLQSLGVFGPAASVMYKYVFLFVVFGAFLEMSGATQFIIDFATKSFGRYQGGPAMVAVVASGLMGSLSGSAVANAVTTGAFTIPMMRSARFPSHIAGGITAAAASGGALMPPVMGAGAYMMLELVQPEGGFLAIMKAAIIPAILYYFSILVFVYLYSRRLGTTSLASENVSQRSLSKFEATVFFGALGALIGLLILGFSPFKAVTGSLAVILVFATLRKNLAISPTARRLAFISFFIVVILHQATMLVAAQMPGWLQTFFATPWISPTTGKLTLLLSIESVMNSSIVGMFGLLIFGLIHPAWKPTMTDALVRSAMNGVSLVAASACVGIVIGIVQQTGIATDFSAMIKGVVATNLFVALLGIMACSLVLGMGVPSVVCYLLLATLMGSLLEQLGVVPLAAHMFIFYFGMMSMVTPPVALAGYAAASIAEAPIMATSFASFRFSLVGFTLPFMFVYRPALCWLPPLGGELTWFAIAHAVTAATIGVVALAGGLAGYFFKTLLMPARIALLVAAGLLLAPITTIGGVDVGLTVDITGSILFGIVLALNAWGKDTEA
jgi:TRAP transporter 4TM/12TM fusion protein